MKLEQELEVKDRQEVQAKKRVEYHYVGSQTRVRGHILYEYNTKTKEIRQADVKRDVEVGIGLQPIYHNRVSRNNDCVYVQALNKKNAIKRLMREGLL